MWETLAGIVLIGFLVLFFGALVVLPLVRAPRTSNPLFTRSMGVMVLGAEIMVLSGILELNYGVVAGAVVGLIGFLMAAAS